MMNLERLALPALIAQWARAVDRLERSVEAIGELAVDVHSRDHLEDLAVRHEIARRVRARPVTAETREMLSELDGIYRNATVECAECVTGNDDAAVQEWTAAREWYFWRRPR